MQFKLFDREPELLNSSFIIATELDVLDSYAIKPTPRALPLK